MRLIPADHETKMRIVVTAEMTAQFEEMGEVHPVYATYWLTRHMELAGRRLILPFLEEGEEAIGYEVTVRHLASALPGMWIEFTTQYVRTEKNRIYVQCQASSQLQEIIGIGQTTQVVLPREKLQAKFATLIQRWKPLQM
ncbi:thioesterase [Dictyobacter alpinus]|uniref:Thioesterase n=1 Tax=Dictyobacter alpinus TaxID=2014873 RepID=A0A402B9P4_9CHLR|nr:thioesterase family protein [Dictyobacter alpinus]GCE28029.1 thioesterase [Dictyobacter alpinus]